MKEFIKKYHKEIMAFMLGICLVVAYLLFANYYEYQGYRIAQKELKDIGCMQWGQTKICTYVYDNLK